MISCVADLGVHLDALALKRCFEHVPPQTMAPKPWFQANIHAPGTGAALLVIAAVMVLQAIPTGICILSPKGDRADYWGAPLTPERVRYCNGG